MPTARPRSRRLLGGRPFHLLLTSLAVSALGDWLYNVALLALVYARTGSPGWVAVTTAARVLPVVVLGPLAGVLADRHDRRRLIVASDLLRAACMVVLALAAATGAPIVLAPALAALATVAGAVHPPCVAACTPALVADADLQRANALRSGIGQAAIVAGPALGALVLAASSPAVAILLNAATFLASAAVILTAGTQPAFRAPAVPAAERASVVADIRSGARALRGAPAALRLVGADVLCSAVYGWMTVTLVVVGRHVGAGGAGYGLLLASFGLGGLAGAAITGRVDAPGRWRAVLAFALAAVAVAVAALGLAAGVAVAIAFALLGGAGMIVGEVLSDTALPRVLDPAVLGRAYGLVFPVSIAGIAAGSLAAGPVLALVGARTAMLVAAGFVVVVGALLLGRPLDARAAVTPGAETVMLGG